MKDSQLLRSVLGLAVPLFLLGSMSPAATSSSLPQAPTNKKPAELSLHIFRPPLPAEGCVGDQVVLDVIAFPKSATYQWRKGGPAVVTVNTGPTITVQPGPANQNVSAGTPIAYSVTATGTGTLTYKWRKKPLVPFSNFADIPGATSSVLDLGNVGPNDGGTYRCIVSDECGPLGSVRCMLIVTQ